MALLSPTGPRIAILASSTLLVALPGALGHQVVMVENRRGARVMHAPVYLWRRARCAAEP